MAVILGVGTVALDTVETPAGSVREAPGGSALYFAAAAGIRHPVAVVGVTGEDFPPEPLDELAALGVDVSGIRRVPHPTFRWHARYDASGHREIVSVHRGGIVDVAPRVPAGLRDPDVLFLGSTDPHVQGRVLDEAGRAALVVLDTMTHWIRDRRSALMLLLRRVDVLLVNEEEVRALAREDDTATAARAVLGLGPRWVVVKRGGRGACAYAEGCAVEVAAAPVDRVVDPTGAGDAFAGGLVASLAGMRTVRVDDVRTALGAAVEMGARAVRAFSFRGILEDERRGRPVANP